MRVLVKIIERCPWNNSERTLNIILKTTLNIQGKQLLIFPSGKSTVSLPLIAVCLKSNGNDDCECLQNYYMHQRWVFFSLINKFSPYQNVLLIKIQMSSLSNHCISLTSFTLGFMKDLHLDKFQIFFGIQASKLNKKKNFLDFNRICPEIQTLPFWPEISVFNQTSFPASRFHLMISRSFLN